MRNQRLAYAKTKMQISFALTAKLISAFVFAKRIVQSLYFLNPKFQASSYRLRLYSLVCVGPGRKPECWFSHDTAQIQYTSSSYSVEYMGIDILLVRFMLCFDMFILPPTPGIDFIDPVVVFRLVRIYKYIRYKISL